MYRDMSAADEKTRNEQFGGMEPWLGALAKMKRDNDIKDEELIPKEHPMLKPSAVSLLPQDDTSFGEIKQPERFPNLRKQYKR